MEKTITINNSNNSLDTLFTNLRSNPPYSYSKEYDTWDVRTNADGQMEQCIVIKKSAMHGMKVHFENDNTLKMTYIIPNKMMNAYFGKSVKQYQNVIEIVANKVKDALLASSQEKAFNELAKVVENVAR